MSHIGFKTLFSVASSLGYPYLSSSVYETAKNTISNSIAQNDTIQILSGQISNE